MNSIHFLTYLMAIFSCTSAFASINNVIGCRVHSLMNRSTCLACRPGLHLSEANKCIKDIVQNCQSTSPSNGVCLECQSGYYLSENACPKQFLANCLSYYNNRNVCQVTRKSAFIGRLLSSGNNSLNCASYNAATNICNICKNLFYLFSNGCQPITDKKCYTSVQNQNLCSICINLYYPKNNVCTILSFANCQTSVQNQNLCQICVSSYFPDNLGKCQLQSLPNCLTYTPNQNYCTFCKFDYNLINGQCVLNTSDNCQTQNGSGGCNLCNSLYYLSGQICLPISDSFCSLSNGIDNICQTCILGYSFQNNLTFCTNSVCIPGVTYQHFSNCKFDSQTCVGNFPGTNLCKGCNKNASYFYNLYGYVPALPGYSDFASCGELVSALFLDQNSGLSVDPTNCVNGQKLSECAGFNYNVGYLNPVFTNSACFDISGRNSGNTLLYLTIPVGAVNGGDPVWSNVQPSSSSLCWKASFKTDTSDGISYYPGVYLCDDITDFCFGGSFKLLSKSSINPSTLSRFIQLF